MANTSGFVPSIAPHRKLESPTGIPLGQSPLYTMMQHPVFRKRLRCGVDFSATSAPLYLFDFSEYPPGASTWEGKGIDRLKVPEEERDKVLMRRVQVMSAFALFLHHAHLVVERQYVSPFRPRESDLLHMEARGGGAAPLAVMERLEYLESSSGNLWRGLNPIPLAVVDCAAELLDATMEADLRAVELAALIGHALTASSESDFPSAVIMGWSACEYFLNKKWESYYSQSLVSRTGNPATVRDRKILDDGRNFTASVRTQILRLANLLSEEQASSLDRVRKQRNDWAHNIKSPNRDSSIQVINLAVQLFVEAYGIEFKVQPGPASNYAI